MRRKLLTTAFLFLVFAAYVYSQPYWYKTQFHTGYYGNCGPASDAMVTYFSTEKDVSVEEVRDVIGPTGKWMVDKETGEYILDKNGKRIRDGATSFEELRKALDKYDVDYQDVDWRVIHAAQIDALLNLGYKMIVLVDLNNINSKENRGMGLGGHYFVLSESKGAYYTVEDPYNGPDVKFLKSTVINAMCTTRFIMVKHTPEWWKRHGLSSVQYTPPVGICEIK